jgi:hypothetical protein
MDVNGVIRLGTFIGKRSPPMYLWLNWLVLGLGWFVPLERNETTDSIDVPTLG